MTAGNGVGFPGAAGGTTAWVSRSPSSVNAGVRTARDTAVQTDWFGVSVHNSLAFGCTSNPVKSLCSNFEPNVSRRRDRKSTRLNSSHSQISYAVFCLKKKKKKNCILVFKKKKKLIKK